MEAGPKEKKKEKRERRKATYRHHISEDRTGTNCPLSVRYYKRPVRNPFSEGRCFSWPHPAISSGPGMVHQSVAEPEILHQPDPPPTSLPPPMPYRKS